MAALVVVATLGLPLTAPLALVNQWGRLAGTAGAAHHVFDHLLDRPVLRASLEDLTNTRIPARDTSRSIFAHVAKPSSRAAGDLPVLVLLHEFFGVSGSICEKAQLLADDLGCCCIAPDTFRGETTTFIPRAIWLALTTPQERVNADLEDVLRWAAEQAGLDATNVAVMGFCYGGGKAIRFTSEVRPSAATIVYYGSPLLDAVALARLRAPVCAVYGAADAQFPRPMIAAFERALKEADVEHEVWAATIEASAPSDVARCTAPHCTMHHR
jgi:carboxymethylenebutenolidase